MACRYSFPRGSMVKNTPASAGDIRDTGPLPGQGKTHWRRKWQPTPPFLSRKSHGHRSLATVREVAESQTRLSMHTQTHIFFSP